MTPYDVVVDTINELVEDGDVRIGVYSGGAEVMTYHMLKKVGATRYETLADLVKSKEHGEGFHDKKDYGKKYFNKARFSKGDFRWCSDAQQRLFCECSCEQKDAGPAKYNLD